MRGKLNKLKSSKLNNLSLFSFLQKNNRKLRFIAIKQPKKVVLLKNLKIASFLIILLFSILSMLIPIKAHADEDMLLKENYMVWRSYTIVKNCLKIDNYTKDSIDTKTEQDALNTFFDQTDTASNALNHATGGIAQVISSAETVGDLYAKLVKINDAGVDCNTMEDMNPVLSQLGIKGILGPLGFKKKLDELMTQKNKSSLSRDDITQYLQGIVTGKGGKLNLFADPAFQYWYWDTIYREGDCKGKMSDGPKGGDFINSNEEGPYYNVKDATIDKPKSYSYANYKTGNNIKGLDGLRQPGDNTPGCATIASYIGGKGGKNAQAYLDLIKRNPKEAEAKTGQDDGGANGPQTCEEQNPTIIIGWLLCSTIGAIDNAMSKLLEAVDQLLYVDSGQFQSKELQAVWSYFRVLATSVLVIIGLVMVISQAISMGPFDAYTVKRLLPRLVIGVIAIQLSWFLFGALINIVNSLGLGIENLMYAPFGGSDGFTIKSILGGDATGFFLAGGVTIIGGAMALGLFGLLAFVGMAMLGVLVGFFLLSIRQFIIVALLLIAPVAIVCWILPNTEKWWKMYWEAFSKLLLMYPLIIFFIAAGRIFAYVASSVGQPTNDGSGWIKDTLDSPAKVVMIVIGLFGPFFLIPKTFQMAGSAFAGIAGFATGRMSKFSSGVSQRSRAKQGKRWSERKTRADESRLFNPSGRLGRFNNLASTMVNPMAAARIKAKLPSGRSLMSQIGQSKWDATEKMAGVLSKSGMNDRALGALTKWDGTQKDLDRLTEQLENSSDHNDQLGGQQLRSNAGFLLNAHRNEEYGRGSVMAAAGLAKASQGFITPQEIADISQRLDTESSTEGLGLGNTFKTSAELAGGRAGALTKPGSSVEYSQTDGWVASDAQSATRIKQVEKLSVQDIGSSKGLGFGEGTNQMGDSLVASLSGPNKSEKAEEIRSTLANAYHSYTTPSVKANIKDVLMSARRTELEQTDQVYNTQMTPEQQQATLERMVANDLRRGNTPTTDEISATIQQPPPPDNN